MSLSDLSRRRLLATLASGGLAGCLGRHTAADGRTAAPIDTDQQWPAVGATRKNTRAIPSSNTLTRPEVDWRQPIGAGVRQPIVANRTVYVAQADGLAAFDVSSGRKRWFYPVDGRVTAPVVGDDTVYAGVTDDSVALVALDGTTGARQWAVDRSVAGPVTASPTLSADGERLYAGTTTEQVIAVEAATGEISWQRDVFGPIRSPVAVASPYIVAASRAGVLYGITDDGSALWRSSLSGVSYVPPVITTRQVFTADSESTLYAFDPVDGTQLWESYQSSLDSAGLVVGYGSLFVESDQQILAVAGSSGSTSWRKTFDHTIECTPLLVGSTLLLGAGPQLVALDAGGGTGVGGLRFGVRRWTVELGRRIGPAMAAGHGRLVVPVTVDSGAVELVALGWQ